MKRLLCVLLLLFSFLFLSGFSFLNSDGVDRSPEIRFNPEEHYGIDTVYVCLSKGYAYHNSRYCDVEPQLLNLSSSDFQLITEYEAIMRGFFECPDCTDRAEYSDVCDIDDIDDTVDDIDDNLSAFLELIFEE